MAPSTKRKAANNDFVYTISDNEADDIIEEEVTPADSPPKKKPKTANKKKQKRAGKGANEDAAEEEEDDASRGVWGQNEENDGAMNPEFEFVVDGGAEELDESPDFEGWGFQGAKKATHQTNTVDIDDIIRRRRQKKGVKADGAEDKDDQAEAEDLDLDDDNDEVLANDAFGMGAASDDNDDEDEAGSDKDSEADEDEDNGSDDDSVSSPVAHPDDEIEESESDDEDDEEEVAKRKDFFAAEEQPKADKKKGRDSFMSMSLSRPILRGLNSVGFSDPTPIQSRTIPIALMGKDVVAGAVTGSGKTAAFLVPILERLLYRPTKVPVSRVVILAPTRELAMQCHAVATKLASHTDIKFCLAVGGLSLKVQEAELRLRPDVIIATPGRFIDHMRNSASFAVDTIEILVLDEADRMLEDGFADELNEILTTLPKARQTMLFSATMTSSVDNLIRVGLNKPVRIIVDSQKKTVVTLRQEFVRLRPGREEKRLGYLLYLCKKLYTERVIIFFREKKVAHRARIIFGLLDLSCAELHGSMSQVQRIQSVEAFRDGKVDFLLATDLASRGLDIKGVDTVINYEAPQKLEIYVHRVGRTARAGRSGVAVTLAAEPDRKIVKAAVKAGKAQGAKISSRVIEKSDADEWQAKAEALEEEIEAVMREEKEEKAMAQADMEVRKSENMIRYEEDIKARPKRTWFETEKEKKAAREAGHAELNGLRESLKKKHGGKNLSNKDKKKLDVRAEATEGRAWKKGAAERAGKGAVLNFKKDKSAKKKGAVAGGRVTKKGVPKGKKGRR